jgi:hypothetical protein
MADSHENAVAIAVLQSESRIRSMQMDRIEKKVDELNEVMNRGKGAYAASLAIAGVIGGCIVTIIKFVWPH